MVILHDEPINFRQFSIIRVQPRIKRVLMQQIATTNLKMRIKIDHIFKSLSTRRKQMKHFLAICLLFTSTYSYAALNKWVDADGKVHYSDTAPADAKVKKMRSSAAPDSAASASGVTAPKSLAEREADWKKSQKSKEEVEQKAALEKENASIKQKNCESARSHLAALEHSQVLVTYDSKGERTFVDDVSRAQRTEETRKAVSSHCN